MNAGEKNTEQTSAEDPVLRRRRWRTPALVALLVVLAAGGGVTFGFGGKKDTGSSRTDLPPAIADVTRADLAQRETVSGTLGYGEPSPLSSAGSGTVTWLPQPGATVSLGEPALMVEGRKVPLLYGDTPLFRELKPGTKGPDVRQLESSLAQLGYSGFTVDDEYTEGTGQALKRWQKHLGLQQTGTLKASDAVVAQGQVRVVSVEAQPGQTLQPGGNVLDYTGTKRQISIDLDAKKQKLVRKDDKVAVTLPDGTRIAATITTVGKVATREGGAGKDQGGGGKDQGGGGKSVIKVTVGIDDKDRDKLGTYDGAPVDVDITSAEKKGVLTVPISALLALKEGGYGVELIDGNHTRIIAVKTGLFANGRVEITGDGVMPGDKVGVPA
ncbi:peptidoglycan-binding protein [Streptomyces lavendulae]|uniref:peptidoglycan-binding protein n=1 Tax=Streptomyces lavendulae TaxID=1914 RepID=UPI0033CFB3BA